MTRNELIDLIARQAAEYRAQLESYLDVYDKSMRLLSSGEMDIDAASQMYSHLIDTQDSLTKLLNRHDRERRELLFDAESYREDDDMEF